MAFFVVILDSKFSKMTPKFVKRKSQWLHSSKKFAIPAFASFDFPNFMDQKIARLPSTPFINTTNILLFLSIISNSSHQIPGSQKTNYRPFLKLPDLDPNPARHAQRDANGTVWNWSCQHSAHESSGLLRHKTYVRVIIVKINRHQ